MRRPETRKIDLDDNERLGEGDFDIRRHRPGVRGRADQLCEAAPRHKWRSEGWSTQARGGFEGGASTSRARWVRGGPWAWARSPEACVRGAESTLCGAMRCEQQELVAVSVSVLRNLQLEFATFDRGCSEGDRAEWRRGNSASAPCLMAPRRALGHGGTMCTQNSSHGGSRISELRIRSPVFAATERSSPPRSGLRRPFSRSLHTLPVFVT